MITTVKDIELKGKRIVMRVDFNVPMKDGKVKAGFDISSLASIVKGGKEAGAGITWGDAAKSSLYVSSELGLNKPTEDAAMPPKKSQEKNPPLTKEQVAKLKAFIEAK